MLEIIQQFSNSTFPCCQCLAQRAVAASHRLTNDASLYTVRQTDRLYSVICTQRTQNTLKMHMCACRNTHKYTALLKRFALRLTAFPIWWRILDKYSCMCMCVRVCVRNTEVVLCLQCSGVKAKDHSSLV